MPNLVFAARDNISMTLHCHQVQAKEKQLAKLTCQTKKW